LISQTSPLFDNRTNGISDVAEELFFSPTHLGPLIWSIGHLFTVPSANAPTGKVLSAYGRLPRSTPGHWVIGVVANNRGRSAAIRCDRR
jgi:hypothetical protein